MNSTKKSIRIKDELKLVLRYVTQLCELCILMKSFYGMRLIKSHSDCIFVSWEIFLCKFSNTEYGKILRNVWWMNQTQKSSWIHSLSHFVHCLIRRCSHFPIWTFSAKNWTPSVNRNKIKQCIGIQWNIWCKSMLHKTTSQSRRKKKSSSTLIIHFRLQSRMQVICIFDSLSNSLEIQMNWNQL